MTHGKYLDNSFSCFYNKGMERDGGKCLRRGATDELEPKSQNISHEK